MQSLDAVTMNILEFGSSIDVEKFLNMPMNKKLRIADLPNLGDTLLDKLHPQLMDMRLMERVIQENNFDQWLTRFQGFWI